MFKAVYSGEAVCLPSLFPFHLSRKRPANFYLFQLDYLQTLHPLSRLRCLAFDHPFSGPRSFPFPSPDGETIRSEKNGDFRVLSVLPGQTVHGVMRTRISTFSSPFSLPR
jgi:hypothetical protein